MGIRCNLCGRWMEEDGSFEWCACGWAMDARCTEGHREWCPSAGPDRAIGAVEF